jgi:hypothetical protein
MAPGLRIMVRASGSCNVDAAALLSHVRTCEYRSIDHDTMLLADDQPKKRLLQWEDITDARARS